MHAELLLAPAEHLLLQFPSVGSCNYAMTLLTKAAAINSRMMGSCTFSQHSAKKFF
jgi:hypothetical protein